MKKLKKDTYLIERFMQLPLAIDAYFAETERTSEHVDICVGEQPESHPYVVVFNEDEDRNYLECRYVELADFENRGEDAKEHLFEVRIRRVYLTTPYRVRESDYQIPARDIFEALVALGQTHHRDEEYELKVLSWRQVR